MVRYRLSVYLLMLLSLMLFKAGAITSLPVEVQDEELSVDRYMAKGDQLVLFISAGMGLPESLFLPKSTSTFRTLDGKVAAKWNVLVFPSTFVIAPDGKIVYGV